MVGYTPTFGGSPVQPGQVSYKSYSYSTGLVLTWPTGLQDTSFPATLFNDLNPAVSGLTVSLPNATQVSPGTAVILSNISASTTQIVNFNGASLTVLDPGIAKYMLLSDNTTPGGVWRVIQFGAGTSSANASALAGPGLDAISGLLNWAPGTLMLGTTPYDLSVGDRAKFVIWNGGAGTLNLPSVSVVGDRWIVMVKNAGSGVWTIDPFSAELIDGLPNIALNPGESMLIECQGGSAWYTVGRGRTLQVSPVNVIDKNIGGLGTSINLTGAEVASQIQRFTAAPALTAAVNLFYGPTSNFYFVDYSGGVGFNIICHGGPADPGATITPGTKAILVNRNGTMYAALTVTGGTVTSIAFSSRFTGGTITAAGNVDLAASGVTAGNYVAPHALNIDTYGRVIGVSGWPMSPPVGTVVDYAGVDIVPAGWLHCAGQAVSRSTYATLFAVIGTTYGVGDNVSTFNVPDCIGRMTICQDYGFGRSNLLGNTLGTVGGSQWLHAHNHTGGDSGHVHGVTDGVGGGGHAHSMVEPLGGHGHVGRDTGHAHTSVSAPNTQGVANSAGASQGYWVSSPAGERPYNIVTSTDSGNIQVDYSSLAAHGIYAGATGANITVNTGYAVISVNNNGAGAWQNLPPLIVFNKIIFAGV